MGDGANLETEHIDDLDVPQLQIVLSREFLRAIGLNPIAVSDTNLAEAESTPNSDLVRVAFLRSLLTFINETSVQQCKAAMFHLVRTTTALSPAPNRGHDDLFRLSNFFARSLAMRIADLTQNHFDRVDQEEFLVNELHSLLTGPDKIHLRYAHDDLIIMVPPADQTYWVPLWADEEAHENAPADWNLHNQPNHLPLLTALKEAASDFTFWREWYQGFLDGKPLDWKLQRRVALIPDEDWDKGPAH